MPSYLHELILLLFRNRSESAADLLRKLDVEPPEHDEVSAESSDLNDLRPAEYRADLVLFLLRRTRKVLGIIVEVQLGCDDDKPYAWPAYIANLRARHRLAARIASAAIVASADIDAERSRLYLDLILISLSANAPEAIEATMNSLGYEYQSDFARRYVAQGRMEIILKVLASRFGPLTEAVQARVRSADRTQIDPMADRMLTARTLEEVLGPLP